MVDKVSPRVTGMAEAATVLLILTMVFLTFLTAYLIRWVLVFATGSSLEIDIPTLVRAVGAALVVFGVAEAGSATQVRKTREILDSTSQTLLKLVGRVPVESPGARTEPFIPRGPYRWVRNPMYSGVTFSLFGLGIAFSSSLFLLWGLVVTLYFTLFLVPWEEKELDALFGESYREYRRQVPMLFPTGRRYRVQTSP